MASEYLPLYIKVGESGAYSDSMSYEEAFCTKEAFGLWNQHVSFVIAPKIKTPITQTWLDEDGDDVFLPPSGIKNESYDLTYSFAYIENDGMANVKISQFIKRIRGKWLKIYDCYTNTCRKGVYLEEIGEPNRYKRRGDQEVFEIELKFKCNFPDFDETF
jgi:hypothetical protein